MKFLVTAFFVLGGLTLSAQTLFYYGSDSVSVQEFLRAYGKNNTGPRSEKAIREYLSLYIGSRLKIREARERGFDTLPQLVSDLDNLRQQIIPSYLNDKESVNKLVEEAFVRSKKDLRLSHIFISLVQAGQPDTVAAKRKLDAVMTALRKPGADFSLVARDFSDDPSVKNNGGDLGWITVFTLPYELENLAYATPVGKLSPVHRSRVGYHIFKNNGERQDIGRMKAAQILLAFPPDASEQVKAEVKKRADSIYARLQKGDDFGLLAEKLSNDVVSAAARGQMQAFGAGQYDPVFERTVFGIATDGAYTKPFLTAHGYHIVKRISKTPAALVKNDKAMELIRVQVEQSDRMATTRSALAKKIMKQAGFKKLAYDEGELFLYSDSIFNYKTFGRKLNIAPSTPLFTIGNKTFTSADWIGFAQTFRFKSDGSGVKPYPSLFDEFIENSTFDYYQAHLEDFNPDFRNQIIEFKEGNLFFEIMQQEIWGPAQTDSTALLSYFEKNRNKYNWKQSADALIFYASDPESARSFSEALKKNPSSLKQLIGNYSEKLVADSGRFELTQIPNAHKQALKAGLVTPTLVNTSDNTASFAYILRTYPPGGSRSFTEARGMVINDYQAELEKSWLAKLEKKYPVRVNERVLNGMVRK